MRLIDADALIKRLAYCVKQGMGATIAYTFMHMIDDEPTVDAVEVVHGEWIPHPTAEEWDVCTACGIGCKRREIGYDAYFKRPYVTEYGYPFCPYCGADMRKGADDERQTT